MAMITEDEAQTKWCPFARRTYQPHAATNRPHIIPGYDQISEPLRCIASQCMAWRWDVEVIPDNPTAFFTTHTVKRERGYCGLAGKGE